MSDQDASRIQAEARAFRDRFSTLMLATCSPDGRPEASLAPFVLDEQERPCVYLSELAAHTANLLANPRASLLFTGDESEARNPFARERLVLQCRALELRGEKAEKILTEMEKSFGETLALLRALPDFHLFAFEVEEGSYIKGFGQAWGLEGNHLRTSGLRRG